MSAAEDTPPADLADARARMMAAMLQDGRTVAVRESARLLNDGLSLADFVLEVLAPIQAEVGRRWQAGQITAAQEHLATEIAEFLLTMAASRQTPATDGAHLALCVADREHHNLPARMVAELLRLEGHRVTFIGSARPGRSLVGLLDRLRPDGVVLSCSLAMNLPALVPLTRTAHDLGLPVVGGGRGFAGRELRAQRLGLDGFALRVEAVGEQMPASGGTLHAGPEADRAGQHDELRAARRPLSDELAERVIWRAERLLPRPLRDPVHMRGYLANLLQFVEAAVLCDEHVLTDYTAWVSDRFATLRADPAAVPTMLEIVRDRLAPDTPLAGAALGTALRHHAAA